MREPKGITIYCPDCGECNSMTIDLPDPFDPIDDSDEIGKEIYCMGCKGKIIPMIHLSYEEPEDSEEDNDEEYRESDPDHPD